MNGRRTQAPIGVVGVGALGGAMAQRLLERGHDVYICDIDAIAVDRVSAMGAVPVESPTAVAARAPVIITCVPGPPEVEACVAGPGGLVEGLREDALLIEMSTSLPATTRQVASKVEGCGATMIDAPVSRGVPAARTGTLSIFVGGTEEAFKWAHNVLATLGTDIIHLGPLGAGHAVKLVNMGLMAVHLLSTAEALSVLPPDADARDTAIACWNEGPARSFMTTHHIPRYVLRGSYDSEFGLGLMEKDLQLAVLLAGERHVPAPLIGRALDVYRIALRHSLEDVDNMRIVPFCWEVLHEAYAVRSLEDPLSELEAHLSLVGIMAALEAIALLRSQQVAVGPALSVIATSSGGSWAVERVAEGASPAELVAEVLCAGPQFRTLHRQRAGLVGSVAHDMAGVGSGVDEGARRWAELIGAWL